MPKGKGRTHLKLSANIFIGAGTSAVRAVDEMVLRFPGETRQKELYRV
jgi:hypothetical protein